MRFNREFACNSKIMPEDVILLMMLYKVLVITKVKSPFSNASSSFWWSQPGLAFCLLVKQELTWSNKATLRWKWWRRCWWRGHPWSPQQFIIVLIDCMWMTINKGQNQNKTFSLSLKC
jgi:hypothetical protein